MSEPTVHWAEQEDAVAAACGASLTEAGATHRLHADDGVTCPDCRERFPAPPG